MSGEILLVLTVHAPDFVCKVKARTRVDRCCRHVAQNGGEDSKDEGEMGV